MNNTSRITPWQHLTNLYSNPPFVTRKTARSRQHNAFLAGVDAGLDDATSALAKTPRRSRA